MHLDPDLPIVLVPVILFGVSAAHIWRRWTGHWRRAATVPLSVVVVIIAVGQPFWAGSRDWSGYDAMVRLAIVVPLGLTAVALVAVVHAAARLRDRTLER
jgi:hypothetical protein